MLRCVYCEHSQVVLWSTQNKYLKKRKKKAYILYIYIIIIGPLINSPFNIQELFCSVLSVGLKSIMILKLDHTIFQDQLLSISVTILLHGCPQL